MIFGFVRDGRSGNVSLRKAEGGALTAGCIDSVAEARGASASVSLLAPLPREHARHRMIDVHIALRLVPAIISQCVSRCAGRGLGGSPVGGRVDLPSLSSSTRPS